MTSKIIVTVHTESNMSAKELQNAMRRFADSGIALPDEGSVTHKGLTVSVFPVKRIPVPSKQNVRTWLADNGHAEVLGKRGRIPADLVKLYEEAHA